MNSLLIKNTQWIRSLAATFSRLAWEKSPKWGA